MAAPRVFLLPKDISSSPSSNFTIISLPHPRTALPTRFLLHPETGLHEITKIAPSATTPRSWLFANPPEAKPNDKQDEEGSEEKPEGTGEEGEEKEDDKEDKKKDEIKAATPKTTDWLGNGQTIQDSSLYVSTPVDPLFVLLPQLLTAATTVDTPKAHFLPLDDILDIFTATDDDDSEDKKDASEQLHWEAALKPGSRSRRQVEARIKTMCDSVDIGGDMAYRVSQEKVLALLVGKCESMVEGGLPKSMEEALIAKPLARPISGIQPREEKEATVAEGENPNGEGEEKKADSDAIDVDKGTINQLPTPPDSQNTSSSSSSSSSPTIPLDIQQLLRIRVASQFLSATYLPAHISALLTTALAATHDFTPLDTYLAELRQLRSDVAALRSGDFILKRSYDDDGDDAAAKRRKREEEEEKKKKNNVSRAVRDLGKVNTRGMAKMTSFFKKKT